MHILDIPEVMLEHILSFLSFDEVAKNRILCKQFNLVCQRILNRGFLMIERRQGATMKAIKALLPRRESERRSHTFSRHCDILTSMETRLSMLNMTYSKFIDQNSCCFIPGKVIDEIRRVLTMVEKSESLPRTHEVLEELRDISSMAIEHFDDKISPTLKNNTYTYQYPNFSHLTSELATYQGDSTQLKALRYCKSNQRNLHHMTKKVNQMESKLKKYKTQINTQNRLMTELYLKNLDQDSCIAELKRRVEECLVKLKEVMYGGKGMQVSSAVLCGPPVLNVGESSSKGLKHYSSQIKLDPSNIEIGSKRKERESSPIIKRRKTTVEPPGSTVIITQARSRLRLANTGPDGNVPVCTLRSPTLDQLKAEMNRMSSEKNIKEQFKGIISKSFLKKL